VLREFGPAANLRAETVEDPLPRPGWAIVALRAAALNWHDVLVREGRYGSPRPHIIGADGAGVRTDTGDEVMIIPSLGWGPDQRAPASSWEILGDRTRGTYAQLVQVPAECLAAKPAGWSWAQAAAFGLVGLTVYRALITRARLRAGESLLVLGAGGGVATAAITLAVALGARVYVTSSQPDKIERARGLGASGGTLYSDPDWPARMRAQLSAAPGFDVVLDSVGNWAPAIATLRPGGRLVVLGASRSERAVLDVRSFYFGQYDLLGTTMGSLEDFAGLGALVASHGVPPPLIDRSFPLADAAAAHEYLESGDAFGKVVLDIVGDSTAESAGRRAEEPSR
jgi:NADPH:quinone reductase-like Zn-dependent oxidoreductase